MKKLPEGLLNVVNGGVLPEGWEQLADQLAPMYMSKYPGISYEEACAKLREQVAPYVDEEADIVQIEQYMRKFF